MSRAHAHLMRVRYKLERRHWMVTVLSTLYRWRGGATFCWSVIGGAYIVGPLMGVSPIWPLDFKK